MDGYGWVFELPLLVVVTWTDTWRIWLLVEVSDISRRKSYEKKLLEAILEELYDTHQPLKGKGQLRSLDPTVDTSIKGFTK